MYHKKRQAHRIIWIVGVKCSTRENQWNSHTQEVSGFIDYNTGKQIKFPKPKKKNQFHLNIFIDLF